MSLNMVLIMVFPNDAKKNYGNKKQATGRLVNYRVGVNRRLPGPMGGAGVLTKSL